MSIFRYLVPKDIISEPNNDHTLGYYEAWAIHEGDFVNYTVSKDSLDTLDVDNLDELHKTKNKWMGYTRIRISGQISDLVIKTNN